MKAATHTLAADHDAPAQRVSRLARAAIDNRPQAVAQRQLQQQLDARSAGTLPLLFSTASPTSVAQRQTPENSDGERSDDEQSEDEQDDGYLADDEHSDDEQAPPPLVQEEPQLPMQEEQKEPQLPVRGRQETRLPVQEEEQKGPQVQEGQAQQPQVQEQAQQPQLQEKQAQQPQVREEQELALHVRGEQVPQLPVQQEEQQALGLPVQGEPHMGEEENGEEVPGSSSSLLALATADTPGPTGGVAMGTNLGASTASLAMNVHHGFSIPTAALKRLTPFQGVANVIAAASDVAGMLTEHRRQPTWSGYLASMGHMGVDLASNALQAGGYFMAPYDATTAATLSAVGNGLGMGVQAYSAYKAWNASGGQTPKEDKAGSAVTALDGVNNAVSTASGILSARNIDAPSWLNAVSAGLSVAAPLATTAMTAYKQREKIKKEFGSIANWARTKFGGTSSFQNGERQRLLQNSHPINAADNMV